MVVPFEILVSVQHADGRAGILRDDQGCWLSGYMPGGSTLLRDYWSSIEGLTHDRSAEGGLLPPGAVGVEVVDQSGRRHRATSANGAWVIVLNEATIGDPCPVRFVDDTGNTIRRPLPNDWPRELLPDRRERCPACGAQDWERARPLDGSFGMRGPTEVLSSEMEPPPTVPTDWSGWRPTPMLACRACGHSETEPTSFGSTRN